MTTLASLITDVYALTNQPDLVAETSLAVRSATLKAHHIDFFPRDIYEVAFGFISEEYIQTLDYMALIPRFRALAYLRRLDNDSGDNVGKDLKIIDPVQALDEYNQIQTEVVYLSGATLKIRTETPWQYFTIGAYRSPDVTETNYSSWIADQWPTAIIYEAVAIIFKTIGRDEQSANYTAMAKEARQEVVISNVQLQGG